MLRYVQEEGAVAFSSDLYTMNRVFTFEGRRFCVINTVDWHLEPALPLLSYLCLFIYLFVLCIHMEKMHSILLRSPMAKGEMTFSELFGKWDQ